MTNLQPQDLITGQNRPKSTRIIAIMQGYETSSFKSNFESWPSGASNPGAEDGKGRVAGI